MIVTLITLINFIFFNEWLQNNFGKIPNFWTFANKQKEDLGHGFNNINKHKIVNLVYKNNIKSI